MEKEEVVCEWVSRWTGSPPSKGWSIICGRDELLYLAERISSEDLEAIILAHNKSMGF